jgi:proteasome lid subunit RPN8/RPN11
MSCQRPKRRFVALERRAALLLSHRTTWDQEEAIDLIRDWGIETAPNEACGLLVLDNGYYEVYHLANEASDPTSGYKMSPASIGEVITDMETWDNDVTIWHTHPGGTVGPSDADLASLVSGCRYLVVTIPSAEVAYFGKE